MSTGDEVVSPSTDGTTPLPIQVSEMVPPRAVPTPAALLQWIAAAGGEPWFPSQHASATGIDRDSLDEPLALLRVAELVQVAKWVRGMGQGYVLTPRGEQALGAGENNPALGDKLVASLHAANSLVRNDLPADAVPAGFEEGEAAYLGLNQRQPFVIAILLIANVLWFFVGLVMAFRNAVPIGKFLTDGNSEILHRIGGLSGIDLLHGEWWRLFSACFVHANAAHILMNLIGLAIIGPLAELLWGRGRLTTIYIISGLAGSCLAMTLQPDSLLVGASGAIWGVMMATLAWFMLFRDRLKPEVAMESLRRLGLAVVLNAGLSFLPGISWEGHLGGAIAGFTTAGLLNMRRFGNRQYRRIALVLLAALPLLCVASLASSMKWSDAWAGLRQRIVLEQMRQAEQVRQAEAAEAAKAFNRGAAPHLARLYGEIVHPIEARALFQLIRTGERRNPRLVAETRKEVGELKAAADAAIDDLSAPPLGVATIDQHRARAKEFAEARLRSFVLLLGMLDAPGIPDENALAAWSNARRKADALWKALVRP